MSARVWSQHLAGDPRARRVRDRVVQCSRSSSCVEHHLVHAHREREVVRRILEQRIAADVHFVEVDARQERRKPERLLVRDEVDLVTAPRERDAELRRDGARPTVGRIAGDADLHATPSAAGTSQRAQLDTVVRQSGERRIEARDRVRPEVGAGTRCAAASRTGASRSGSPHAAAARDVSPRDQASHGVVACGVPRRRVRWNCLHQPSHLVGPPVIEHVVDPCGDSCAPTTDQDRPQDSAARQRDVLRTIAMQIAHATAREQRDLDGAQ